MDSRHQPVLSAEVAAGLALSPGEILVDATVGGGGHSAALCQILGSAGRLIGLDLDRAAIARAEVALGGCPCQVKLLAANFARLGQVLQAEGLTAVDAILFDLGMSSDQLETSGRGFSFQRDEPLLMTLGDEPTGGQTAREIISSWPVEALEQIFRDYGEEQFAASVARAIVRTRRRRAIQTTAELVAVIKGAVPEWYQHRRLHFATKTFQALRMAVNDELEVLERGLVAAWRVLRPGGRLAVISFHSLEARAVKEFSRVRVGEGAAALVNKKAIRPTWAEVKQNPRARSATLRILRKL